MIRSLFQKISTKHRVNSANYSLARFSQHDLKNRPVFDKFSMILICSALLILLLAMNLWNRYFVMGTVSTPALLAMLATSLIIFFETLEDRVRWAGIYLAAIGALLVPLAVYEEGGLGSVPVLWFPVIPLIALCFSHIKDGLIFTFIVIAEISAFWVMHERNLMPAGDYLGVGRLYPYAAIACIAITSFGSALLALSRWHEEEAHKQLKESEKQFRVLTSKIPVMVWRINKYKELDFANHYMSLFLGYRDYNDIKNIVYAKDTYKVLGTFLRAWRDKSSFTIKFRTLQVEGKVRWVECIGVPKHDSSGFIGYVGVCIDVTERILKEKALTDAKNKADQESIAKSRYLASLSHEIRTPMGVILGYADLLQECDHLPADCSKHIEAIGRNASHLLDLLNNALDISKIEANAFQSEKKVISLKKEIDSILEPFQLSAHQRNIAFVIENHLRPEYENIYTDPLLMRQVLVNLVSNAIKFTNSGEVRVKIDALLKSPGTYIGKHKRVSVRISVSDTGPGISRRDQKLIFRPFFQTIYAKSASTGTGLGLALSKGLAQIMGGRLYLKSSLLGKGSNFIFEFDAQLKKDVVKYSPNYDVIRMSGVKDSFVGRKFLIADDLHENREYFATLFGYMGAFYEFAHNGREAVSLVREKDYDLILMDIMMPKMNGIQATRYIRNQGIKTPIIGLSAHIQETEKMECLEAGCTSFLSKPAALPKLVSVIQNVLADPGPDDLITRH